MSRPLKIFSGRDLVSTPGGSDRVIGHSWRIPVRFRASRDSWFAGLHGQGLGPESGARGFLMPGSAPNGGRIPRSS